MEFTINLTNKSNMLDMLGSPSITLQAMAIINSINDPKSFVHESCIGGDEQIWTLYITINRANGTNKTFEYLREIMISHGDIESQIPYFLDYDTEFGSAYNPFNNEDDDNEEIPIPENALPIKKSSHGRT